MNDSIKNDSDVSNDELRISYRRSDVNEYEETSFDAEGETNKKDLGFELSIDLKKFNEGSKLNFKNDKFEQPKYNLKIKKRDMLLIDEIARAEGKSRAELLNSLIMSFLWKELLDVKDEVGETSTVELRMLIAAKADALAKKMQNPDYSHKYKLSKEGWTGDLVGHETYDYMDTAFNYGLFQESCEPYYAHMAGSVDVSPEKEDEYIEQFRTETYKSVREKLEDL